jgi:magnesium transporter
LIILPGTLQKRLMARFIKDRSASRGTAPGSLIFIGQQKLDKPVFRLMEYDKDEIEERELESVDEFRKSLENQKVSWLNIYGLHDVSVMEKAGEMMELNPLFMEDALNTDQRPFYQDGNSYDAFILKMLSWNHETEKIQSEQISLILGENYVVTFQEQIGDVFDPVRARIRLTNRRQRLNDNDYLMYALLDTIVDNYILLVEQLGRNIEELGEELFKDTNERFAVKIFSYKTELNYLRKSIRPLLEIFFQLQRSDSSHFQAKNLQYLKDLNDLVLQTTDAIELYSNMISDHLNIYNTNVSNRMNQVMKVLTIFASIFIPLTFFAGIYGMNFEHIPELEFRYSYPIFWGVVVIIAVALLLYFRRKKWL